MTLADLILSRRSIRQFASRPVARDILNTIVDAGRLAPSAANLQPLEFVVVDEDAVRAEIFPCLKWAAYITPSGNPAPGREPRAYVIVLVNTSVREKMYEYDVGASVENMALAALSHGLGGCWLISIDKPKIASLLNVPDSHKVDSVLALGYPAQESRAEEFKDSPRYWQDADFTFHVPKRALTSVVHFNRFR